MNNNQRHYLESLSKQETYELLNKEFFKEKTLAVEKIDRGYILPPIFWRLRIKNPYNKENSLHGQGGVLTKERNYVDLSAQKAIGMHDRVNGKYDISKFDIEVSHEKVIYMNFYIHQWGHFLLDVIGRLWYAAHIDKESKIVYTTYMGQTDSIDGNYLELIKLMGIDTSRLICINKVTQFDEVIVPETSILPGEYFTEEYRTLFDIIVNNALSDASKLVNTDAKIYCSRSRVKKAGFRENGEEFIEEILNNNGYISVSLEKHSLTEQIIKINSCETIALINGSLAHNLLFLRKHCNVYIFNKTYRINRHQFLVNQTTNANITFVDTYVSPLPILYGYGPFLIRRTNSFYNFCKDNGISFLKGSIINTQLSIKDRLWYYTKYIYLYRRFFISGKKIKESYLERNSFSEIRKHYKLTQTDNEIK